MVNRKNYQGVKLWIKYILTYSYSMDNSLTMLDKIHCPEIGYAGVELSGLRRSHGIGKRGLKRTGIEVVQLGKIEEELPFLAELGAKFICPMHASYPEEGTSLTNKLNDLGEGIRIRYEGRVSATPRSSGRLMESIS